MIYSLSDSFCARCSAGGIGAQKTDRPSDARLMPVMGLTDDKQEGGHSRVGRRKEEIAAGCRQILGDAASWLFRPVRSPQSSSLWTQAYAGLRRRRDSGRCGGCEINRFSAFNSASRRLERLSLGAMEYTLRRKGILLNRCRRPCRGVDFSNFAVSQPLSDILATPVVSEDSLAVARSWGSTYHFR